MVVVGRLVGTFEPARVIVTIAQVKSASARANTVAPSQPAGTVAGTNGKGRSQLSASPPSTATAHAIGGRIMTFRLFGGSELLAAVPSPVSCSLAVRVISIFALRSECGEGDGHQRHKGKHRVYRVRIFPLSPPRSLVG